MRARHLRPLIVRREASDPALWGSQGNASYEDTPTRGWIQPLSASRAAKLSPPPGSELPVPAFVAYLVPDAPVCGSGFTLIQESLTYQPIGIVQDAGAVGHHLEVLLTAPAALEVTP